MPQSVYTVKLGELSEVPGTPFSYWVPEGLRDIFQKFPPLDRDVAGPKNSAKIADIKHGLKTSDDLCFTRFYWEIDLSEITTNKENTLRNKWVPFVKGGLPFYFDVPFVVDWGNQGEKIKNWINPKTGKPYSNVWMLRTTEPKFFFRSGLAWLDKLSWKDTGSPEKFKIFYMPEGTIFSQVTYSGFIDEKKKVWPLLAFLRSQLGCVLYFVMDPNIQHTLVGNVAKMPVNQEIFNNQMLAILAKEAYWLLREWDTGNEMSTQFIMPWVLQVWRGFDQNWRPVTGHPLARDFEWSDFESAKKIRGEGGKWDGEVSLTALANECVERELKLRKRIEEIQNEIDEEVYRIYGISEEDRNLIEKELGKAGKSESEESGEEEVGYEVIPPEEHIQRLLSYYALEVIKEDDDGIVPANDMYISGKKEPGIISRVIQKLKDEFGEENLDRIENELNQVLGDLDKWFVKEFFNFHTSLYRARPIIWQISSEKFRSGKPLPAFSCFIYWHKLDADTIPKVRQLYLKPYLESVQREIENLRARLSKEEKSRKKTEKELDEALKRYDELKDLDNALDKLLKGHELKVTSRSDWVKEKVNEIIKNGYKPERDYGVRVNIEPLKQAKVVAKPGDRVKG